MAGGKVEIYKKWSEGRAATRAVGNWQWEMVDAERTNATTTTRMVGVGDNARKKNQGSSIEHVEVIGLD